MDPEDTAGNQCKVQLEVLYLIPAIPNQFHNLLLILYHFDNLPWVWKVAVQKGCHSHHQYHHNLGQRDYRKCLIQMCFELEELHLKVVMTGLETRVEIVLGTGESCGNGGAMKVIWITGVLNCVELLAPWDRLFLKLCRVFGDNGRGRYDR